MGRFRNNTDLTLHIPEGTPSSVPPEGLFTVPDDRDDAFEASPHCSPAAPPRKKTPGKGE